MAYSNNHPPLPGLASGVEEAQVADIAVGTPLDPQNLIDSRSQHKTRKRLSRHNPPLATDAEVIDSKRRKVAVEIDHFAPGGIVALTTAVNDLAAAINHPVNGLAALAAAINHPVNGLTAAVNNFSRGFHTERARNINRSMVRTSTDQTRPVPNAAGDAPPDWFATISLSEIERLRAAPTNNRGLHAIMEFYGAPIVAGQTNDEKKDMVKSLLGITI